MSALAYRLLLELSASLDEVVLPGEVANAFEFMRKNVESSITNDDIAAAVCKSVSRLSALFQKHLGVSPIERFIRTKMAHAWDFTHANQ